MQKQVQTTALNLFFLKGLLSIFIEINRGNNPYWIELLPLVFISVSIRTFTDRDGNIHWNAI